jgi:uncharacterized protein (DUF305 family)
MRIPRVVCVLTAVAVAGGVFAGCGSKTTARPVATPLPGASNAPAPNPQQQHNQADVVFLQNMITHHIQALAMSQMARNQASSSQVKDLAGRIETEQSPQIQQMSGLLTEWRVPAPSTAGAMGRAGMPGMVNGTGFDRMFLQMMIVHHQGAVDMSQTELAQGSNSITRNLAQQIISAQQAEISEMQALLQVI